jgi:hypothetical protein
MEWATANGLTVGQIVGRRRLRDSGTLPATVTVRDPPTASFAFLTTPLTDDATSFAPVRKMIH